MLLTQNVSRHANAFNPNDYKMNSRLEIVSYRQSTHCNVYIFMLCICRYNRITFVV